MCYKNFITCAKEINCFRILFACWFFRLNAKSTEWICMQISRSIVNATKVFRFWWESGLLSTSRKHLTTFCRTFVHYACWFVFRDTPLYAKELSLFCLLWLLSTCPDGIGYITNFSSMIEQLHEPKTAVVNYGSIQEFDNVSARKKEN